MSSQAKVTLQPNSGLARACSLALLELCEKEAFADLPEPVFSAAFTRKIRKFTSLTRGNKYHRLTRTAKILIAAAILALLLSLSAVAAKQFGFSLINFGTDGLLNAGELHRDITPLEYGYIPEGFTLEEESFNEKTNNTDVIFMNDDNQYIMISKRGSYDVISVDTEGKSIYKLTKDGNEYTILEAEDKPTAVYWMEKDSGILFSIQSQLDVDTILKIARACK